jgi:hypothetical protein
LQALFTGQPDEGKNYHRVHERIHLIEESKPVESRERLAARPLRSSFEAQGCRNHGAAGGPPAPLFF